MAREGLRRALPFVTSTRDAAAGDWCKVSEGDAEMREGGSEIKALSSEEYWLIMLWKIWSSTLLDFTDLSLALRVLRNLFFPGLELEEMSCKRYGVDVEVGWDLLEWMDGYNCKALFWYFQSAC